MQSQGQVRALSIVHTFAALTCLYFILSMTTYFTLDHRVLMHMASFYRWEHVAEHPGLSGCITTLTIIPLPIIHLPLP